MKIKTYQQFILIVLLFGGCDIDRNSPGYEYFDDMTRSAAYETYTPNSNFSDGKTMQLPPEGTIPITGKVLHFVKTEEDRLKAANTLLSPLEENKENRQRGEEVYTIYCSNCHGPIGDGKGNLYTSKKYSYPPASLLSEKIRGEKAGGIFHAISAGYGIMGAHGPLISETDRWNVVQYIQQDLQK